MIAALVSVLAGADAGADWAHAALAIAMLSAAQAVPDANNVFNDLVPSMLASPEIIFVANVEKLFPM